MKYITASRIDPNQLDAMVSDLLASDYELYGHPYAVENYHCQALIKKEEVKTTFYEGFTEDDAAEDIY